MLIIAVGNTMRSDDGIGPFIAGHLSNTQDFSILDAGINPENVIDEAVSCKPSRIIIIDAADFQGHPGEARIIDEEHIPQTSLSTHSIPLPVITHILKEDTQAEIIFLGIQPRTMDFGENLTLDVQETGQKIVKVIKDIFPGS